MNETTDSNEFTTCPSCSQQVKKPATICSRCQTNRSTVIYSFIALLCTVVVVLATNYFHVFSPTKEAVSDEQKVATQESEEEGGADTSPAMAVDSSGRELVESILTAQINGPAFSADDIKAIAVKYEPVQPSPAHARHLSDLGAGELAGDDLESAELHTIESLGQDPLRAVAWGNLGLIYAKKEEKEKAVACFLIRKTVSPKEATAYLKSLKADKNSLIHEAAEEALKEISTQ